MKKLHPCLGRLKPGDVLYYTFIDSGRPRPRKVIFKEYHPDFSWYFIDSSSGCHNLGLMKVTKVLKAK